MCEETGLIRELLSEASHPRVAGIVQTHRQHIDAQHGQHAVEAKDIAFGTVSGVRVGVKRTTGGPEGPPYALVGRGFEPRHQPFTFVRPAFYVVRPAFYVVRLALYGVRPAFRRCGASL